MMKMVMKSRSRKKKERESVNPSDVWFEEAEKQADEDG